MLVNQAFRYELDPTVKQRVALGHHAGARRWAWNWGLRDRIKRFENNEGKAKFASAIDQHKALVKLKAGEAAWLYEVSKWVPQNALRDLDKAFAKFRAGRKTSQRVGFPKFKKRRDGGRFRVEGHVKIATLHRVQLPGIGCIRTKESTGKFRGRILSATVKEEADRWYVSFAVEVERPDPVQPAGPAIGIDLGLTTFATISNGETTEKIEAPKPLKANLRKVARYQRPLSSKRRKKGSKRREKARVKLARLHRRIRNIRNDFLHKLTSRLAGQNREIHIEDLNVGGMVRNRHLAKAISDAGWGKFRELLAYKCEWYGSRLVIVDRWFPSSKTCSGCGAVKSVLLLSDRQYACDECGLVVDRDENAAMNLLNRTSTGSFSGSYARGDHGSGRRHKPTVKPGRGSENLTVAL